MRIVLSVKNLTRSYGNLIAVKGVSFDVAEGEIFALIGPNGAGKSTALKIIATVLKPTSGVVFVAGMNVVKEADKVRESISYLPEEAGAYRRLRGREYLWLMAGLITDLKQRQDEFVERAIKIADLGVRINDKISTYSKGMTRKILLGRALMSEPKLAILDEPTSGLDVINALEVRDVIRSSAKGGMAVLLSSHNMLEIEYLSDRVAIIDQGKIFEIGTPGGLKKKYRAGNLEEVFRKVVEEEK